MNLTKPCGCHNRAPITTVCQPKCQYINTRLGQADARCLGCKERVEPATPVPTGSAS